MNTLIIPCAGRSSRFPNMRPKYLLTHPDGKLMVQKAIEAMDFEMFDQVVIVIVKFHCEIYEADLILNQAFAGSRKIRICILDDFTSCAAETIYQTINKLNITGSITIKDSDNKVEYPGMGDRDNFVVGKRLSLNDKMSNIPAKSFIRINSDRLLLDIIEKKIVSDIVCLGVYGFKDVNIFTTAYQKLLKKNVRGEIYISHVLSYILKEGREPFFFKECTHYEDWGTLEEWKVTQNKCATYFVDFDGVLIKNSGRFGRINWNNNFEMIESNCAILRERQLEGAQIIITTSRPEEYRRVIEKLLDKVGLRPFAILMGLNHAPRFLINDFAPSNPYPTAMGISIPRNGKLNDYL